MDYPRLYYWVVNYFNWESFVNKCMFIGNLTRDPELIAVGDTQKCRFGLAVNGRPYTNKAGEKTQDTLFVDCEAWSKGAELIAKFFTKGKPIVIVDSEMRLDQWEDKNDGSKRSKHYLRVNEFAFPPKNAGAESGGGGGESAAAPVEDEAPKTRGRKPKAKVEDDGSDIPF